MSAVLVSGLTLKVDETVLREFFSYRCAFYREACRPVQRSASNGACRPVLACR